MPLSLRILGLAILLGSCSAARADEPEDAFVEALSAGKLMTRGEFKAARSALSTYFEKKYAAEIRAGFGEDADKIGVFLAANPEIRDTLFTALDPEEDKLEAAFAIFRGLFDLGADKLKAHANLAVALCVVWDDPKGVYDYAQHQRRTRSLLPEDPMKTGWKENYEFLVSHDGELKGAVQNLPWEFLVHMVNHRTPAAERDWAIKNYIKKRAGIGGIYPEIVYDHGMLKTEIALGYGKSDCRLTGQNYTLAGIKKYGGVCAHQADYAARVAKSIAVPAEYVTGTANSGVLHAWVMWVELKSVTKEKVDFAMKSEGRYFGDQYYIGHITEPKTCNDMTDRDMERRLTTIGVAPQNARHADLLMRMYPMYKEKKSPAAKQKLAFALKALEIFPYCEKAWLEVADIAKDGQTVSPSNAIVLATRVLTSFGNFPDFSWSLFDALLTSQKDKLHRNPVFERAVLKYEALGRPDLACECRLKWAEYLEESKDYKKAAEGLAQTINKFPSEGRYVPKVLDKLADICAKYKDGTKKLAKFYLDFLPLVPKKRGDTVTAYAVTVHEQALKFFRANDMAKEADLVETELKQLKRAQGTKS